LSKKLKEKAMNNTRPTTHTTSRFVATGSYLLRRDRFHQVLAEKKVPADLIASIKKVGTETPVFGWQAEAWYERLRPFMSNGFNPFETPDARRRYEAERAAAIARTHTFALATVWGKRPSVAVHPASVCEGSLRAKAAQRAFNARLGLAV
jgi:hypothetical protein